MKNEHTGSPLPPLSPLPMSPATPAGAVTGAPVVLLRIEGALMLAFATWAFAALAGDWALYFGLFFAPDVAFLGYLAGPRVGAIAYNTTHSLLGPAALAALHLVHPDPLVPALALIWVAHIGFDRLLGYGLKYGTAFAATHLGRVGRFGPAPAPEARPEGLRLPGAHVPR